MSNIKSPLVHSITNVVTMNDLAQIIYCYGGKPIMAKDLSEMEEITSICDALLINIGTIETREIESIKKACAVANSKGIPVVLDPVGAHVSKLRMDLTRELIENYKIALIKGNLTEIKGILGYVSSFKGLDSMDNELSKEFKEAIKSYCRETGVMIVITGEVDFFTDGIESYYVHNGCNFMAEITGTGCMLGALLAVALGFAAPTGDQSNSEVIAENKRREVIRALTTWGISGEIAKEQLKENQGLLSFKLRLLDNVSVITEELRKEREKVTKDA